MGDLRELARKLHNQPAPTSAPAGHNGHAEASTPPAPTNAQKLRRMAAREDVKTGKLGRKMGPVRGTCEKCGRRARSTGVVERDGELIHVARKRTGYPELSDLCDQLGTGGRDTVRLLVYCAHEADFKRRSAP